MATREQLAQIMRAIAALADDTGVDVSDALPPIDADTRLGPPFLFAVCGEINAGKSTLLNAIFGEPVCPVSVLPETKRVIHYHHAPQDADLEVSESFVEAARVRPFLRDFELIDMPGANTPNRSHLDAAAEWLDRADFLMCVFPVDNPWGAATWNFLEALPACVLDRTVFVIQQADRREPRDLDIIRGHMRDLSMKRLGRLPPVFAVSAQEAFDARCGTSLNRARLRASDILALEEHIANAVCMSPERIRMLDRWRVMAATALRAVDDRLELATRGIEGHARFLEDIEREIDGLCDGFTRRLPHHLDEVAEVFETEAETVVRKLRRSLGVLPSAWRLFTGARVSRRIEALFIQRLKAAVETVAAGDADEVVRACRAHWDGLGPRVTQTLGIRPGDDARVDATLHAARDTYIQRIGRAAGDGVAGLNTRRQLERELRMRKRSLTSFTIATLGLTTVGAVFGGLGVPMLPWIFCGLASVFLVGGVAAALVTRRSITREYRSNLLDTCGQFAGTLRSDSEDALRRMFKEYSQNLAVVREHLVREQQSLEPRKRRWHELFLSLKAVEQEW